MALLFWPRHSDRSPFGRISTLLRRKSRTSRPDWEKIRSRGAPMLGLHLAAGTVGQVRDGATGAPEEVFRELRDADRSKLADAPPGKETWRRSEPGGSRTRVREERGHAGKLALCKL